LAPPGNQTVNGESKYQPVYLEKPVYPTQFCIFYVFSTPKQMSIKIPLSFLFFMTALVMGLGTTMFATNVEGKPPVLKTEGLPSPPTVGGGVSMRVLWTVSEYRVGGSAVWGKEEARTLLFKPLDIDVTTITFDGKTCRDVIFKKETVKAKEYLDHLFHTTPQALGIEEEVVELVKTNCDLPGFSEYMRLKDRRIVIHINGVFFYFKPAVNY
jgi:hypothetical protein